MPSAPLLYISALAALAVAAAVSLALSSWTTTTTTTTTRKKISVAAFRDRMRHGYLLYRARDLAAAKSVFSLAFVERGELFQPSDLYNLASLLHDGPPGERRQARTLYRKSIDAGFSAPALPYTNLASLILDDDAAEEPRSVAFDLFRSALAATPEHGDQRTRVLREFGAALLNHGSSATELDEAVGVLQRHGARFGVQALEARTLLARALLKRRRGAQPAHGQPSDVIRAAELLLRPVPLHKDDAARRPQLKDARLLHTIAQVVASGEGGEALARRAYARAEEWARHGRPSHFVEVVRSFRRPSVGRRIGGGAADADAPDGGLWSLPAGHLLSVAECQNITRRFQDEEGRELLASSTTAFKYSVSGAADHGPRSSQGIVRTSSTAGIPDAWRRAAPFAQLIQRVAETVGINVELLARGLELQVVKYQGRHQRFELHQDAGPLFPRLFSAFVYLNTPARGGETCFPFISAAEDRLRPPWRRGDCGDDPAAPRPAHTTTGVCASPVAGNALLWFNLATKNGSALPALRHRGCPMLPMEPDAPGAAVEDTPTKWGLNIWFEIS